jgi:hypothetical protein
MTHHEYLCDFPYFHTNSWCIAPARFWMLTGSRSRPLPMFACRRHALLQLLHTSNVTGIRPVLSMYREDS